MRPVHVVGLGVDYKNLTPLVSRLIYTADVLVGGTRLLAGFHDHPGMKIPIRGPLSNVIERVKQEMLSDRDVVVLADGDPLFFGIGTRLIKALGAEHVLTYPNVTILQAAASKMKIPWQDIRTVSLHGKNDIWPLLRALVSSDFVAVYTDHDFHPARIAEELIQRNVDGFRMRVFENLGGEREQIRILELCEARESTFSPLNLVLLQRVMCPEIPLRLGIEDSLYLHKKGLITKREVRAFGLCLLDIQPHHTIWDLGAGCGSVAIEASVLAREGKVFAVERDPIRVQLIRENLRRTGAYLVEAICGEMPSCLELLPDPDRIFIGGGIGRDNSVLEMAARRLKPGGKLVLHLILFGSLIRARQYLNCLGWPFCISQVQVSRSKNLAGDQRLEALNPVYILSATKPEELL
nr:precorrin-6y C5,15-methyltransferase (decarboxylating) subunit CbiE [Desulfobacterales bacterium]